ncbi:MAG: bile acid:sodium symporter family protein [Lewinella sp.]|nr:bile acid:sodium symporter family protein [Lewinella sp.]
MSGKTGRILLWTGLAAFGLFLVALVAGLNTLRAPLAVFGAIASALGLRSVPALKNYQYTAWIVVAIICGMVYPSAFLRWGDIDLRNPWLILGIVQLVMFGMGTQMSFRDLKHIRTMAKGVFVGILCQFTIMPLTGYGLTRIFHFEPEIAAGIILIGSCSSGLASNVMAYLAKANLTLSVTLTTVATLLAPLMTPFWMKMLAGTYVEVDFLNMFVQIVKIVVVPIGAAMLYDVFKSGSDAWVRRVDFLVGLACLWLVALLLGLGTVLAGVLSPQIIELLSFLPGAVVVGKLYYVLTTFSGNIRDFMPKLSMFGIVYFTLVTTAASRENILAVGLLLLLVAMLHNALGYALGYGISRALGLGKDDCRTIALEVGLQNGGMASGLAGVMGKLATLGLAAAIFSPWMNITGSLLGNYWRRRKGREGQF